jgi:hypothetical protein
MITCEVLINTLPLLKNSISGHPFSAPILTQKLNFTWHTLSVQAPLLDCIVAIELFDFFPHTYHIESLARLSRIGRERA